MREIYLPTAPFEMRVLVSDRPIFKDGKPQESAMYEEPLMLIICPTVNPHLRVRVLAKTLPIWADWAWGKVAADGESLSDRIASLFVILTKGLESYGGASALAELEPVRVEGLETAETGER